MSREAVKQRLLHVRAHFDHDGGGPLRERVFRALRAAILGGQLASGDRITEADLAEALNVSRTPLREAFRGLEAEGLVAVADQRGVVVKGLNAKDLMEIYEIRAALDVLAARGAAQRMDDLTLKRLADNVDMAEFLLQKQRWDELRRQFREFHEIVQEACGNARLSELLAGMQEYSSRAVKLREWSAESAASTHNDHIRLYKALAARDPEAAAEAARAHVAHEEHKLVAHTEAQAKAHRASA